MNVSLTEAETKLGELVRRAEAGEDVILTLNGQPAARIVPVPTPEAQPTRTVEERVASIRRIREEAAGKALPGPDAARSQDYLYDDKGLPA